MEEDHVGSRPSEQILVHLERGERRAADLGLRLLAHAGPDVGIDHVGPRDGPAGVVVDDRRRHLRERLCQVGQEFLGEGVARRAGASVCGEELLSLSVGDAFYPEDGDDVEQLLALADRRMYQMKHVHRSERSVRETVASA